MCSNYDCKRRSLRSERIYKNSKCWYLDRFLSWQITRSVFHLFLYCQSFSQVVLTQRKLGSLFSAYSLLPLWPGSFKTCYSLSDSIWRKTSWLVWQEGDSWPKTKSVKIKRILRNSRLKNSWLLPVAIKIRSCILKCKIFSLPLFFFKAEVIFDFYAERKLNKREIPLSHRIWMMWLTRLKPLWHSDQRTISPYRITA